MTEMMALSQWSPGISLAWALVSLSVGILILVVIALRLWRDHTRGRAQEVAQPESEKATDKDE